MASHGIFYSMASIQSCHEFFQEMKEFLIRFFPFPHTSLLSYTSVVVSMHSHFAFRSHLYHYIYIYFFFFTYRKSISITGNPLRFLAQHWSRSCTYNRNHVAKEITKNKNGRKHVVSNIDPNKTWINSLFLIFALIDSLLISGGRVLRGQRKNFFLVHFRASHPISRVSPPRSTRAKSGFLPKELSSPLSTIFIKKIFRPTSLGIEGSIKSGGIFLNARSNVLWKNFHLTRVSLFLFLWNLISDARREVTSSFELGLTIRSSSLHSLLKITIKSGL